MSIYFSAKLNSRRSLQLSLDSLPDAPVTAVRPEEKTNAPVDTEAPAEDVDDVIELPDVPVKAPKRPEAPEKTKGFVSCSFSIFIVYPVSLAYTA
jgi:hypothetical protein